jgi:hypothetical protein
MATAPAPSTSITAEERKVIFASSLGTVFEWYDFYLYGYSQPSLQKNFLQARTRTPHSFLRCWRLLQAFWCGHSARSCSVASVTWWAVNTRS